MAFGDAKKEKRESAMLQALLSNPLFYGIIGVIAIVATIAFPIASIATGINFFAWLPLVGAFAATNPFSLFMTTLSLVMLASILAGFVILAIHSRVTTGPQAKNENKKAIKREQNQQKSKSKPNKTWKLNNVENTLKELLGSQTTANKLTDDNKENQETQPSANPKDYMLLTQSEINSLSTQGKLPLRKNNPYHLYEDQLEAGYKIYRCLQEIVEDFNLDSFEFAKFVHDFIDSVRIINGEYTPYSADEIAGLFDDEKFVQALFKTLPEKLKPNVDYFDKFKDIKFDDDFMQYKKIFNGQYSEDEKQKASDIANKILQGEKTEEGNVIKPNRQELKNFSIIHINLRRIMRGYDVGSLIIKKDENNSNQKITDLKQQFKQDIKQQIPTYKNFINRKKVQLEKQKKAEKKQKIKQSKINKGANKITNKTDSTFNIEGGYFDKKNNEYVFYDDDDYSALKGNEEQLFSKNKTFFQSEGGKNLDEFYPLNKFKRRTTTENDSRKKKANIQNKPNLINKK